MLVHDKGTGVFFQVGSTARFPPGSGCKCAQQVLPREPGAWLLPQLCPVSHQGFLSNQSRWALGSSPEAGKPILLFGLSPEAGLSQGCSEREAASETHTHTHMLAIQRKVLLG